MPKVYLSLGSNLGDRDVNLEKARQAILETFPGACFSNVYETEPVEYLDQPWFLNQVAELKTEWPPETLLEWTQRLENRLGRRREIPKGPRTLDVDIVLYGERLASGDKLTLPHPGLTRRRHILVPLSELAAEKVLPGFGFTVADAIKNVKDNSQVKVHAQP
jgi:2-amino-4-hydroxy-6-hydroxymethyldihydropteridine diphosphokinase